MEYNLFLTNSSPYQVIGYDGNGSRGYVRYAMDWSAFLPRNCPYILTIVMRSRRIERQNGDILVRATGFLGENFESGVTTSKQSSQVIGILKNYNGSKNIGNVLTSFISYGNGFKTYLAQRPASPFFEIELLTLDGLPAVTNTTFPFEYNLILNFKEVIPAIPLTLNPKTHQVNFYIDNAQNAPVQFSGTPAIFNVDWSFLEERPYLMRFIFYSTIHSGTPIQQQVHFCSIPTLNSISNSQFTGTKIMNQNTNFIGISRQRSYQNDGEGYFHSEIDDNPPSTILTRPKSNILIFYSVSYNLAVPSQSQLRSRWILYFTEL